MATVNTKYTRAIGRNAFTSYHTIWDSTSNHSAVTIIDLSADADSGNTNSISIQKVKILSTAGIDVQLLFDATTDEQFIQTILGSTESLEVDFSEGGRSGIEPTATGFTGDLVVTTTSAASGDEMLVLVWWRSS
jgi:hypothetical protein